MCSTDLTWTKASAFGWSARACSDNTVSSCHAGQATTDLGGRERLGVTTVHRLAAAPANRYVALEVNLHYRNSLFRFIDFINYLLGCYPGT